MPPLNVSLLLATSALTLVLAAPASAQSAAPATPAPQSQAAAQKPAQPATTQTPVQTTPAQGAAEEPVETVTITGSKPVTKIDRDIYDPKTDPDTPTSSASDALNKAPGVNVDPEGNVTLRGNSNVQIYIDGKPSAMTQGEFRAMTLQSTPADDIDTVEVLTNPGAEFGAEGGAGIININLKKGRVVRPQLFMTGGAGSFGRFNVGGQGAYGKKIGEGTLTVRGGLFANRDVRESSTNSLSENIRSTGKTTTQQRGEGKNTNDGYRFTTGIEYAPNDRDSLGAQVVFNKGTGDSRSDNFTEINNVDGSLSDRYDSNSRTKTLTEQANLQLSFNHKGDQEGESFRTNIQTSGGESSRDQLSTLTYMNPARDNIREFYEDGTEKTMSISADYTRRMWGGVFATGFDINTRNTTSDASQYNTIVSTGVRTVDARRTQAFVRDQDQLEGYITYQRPIGEKWNLLGGLRVEETEVALNQKTLGESFNTSYINYHPSFAAQYMLSDKSKLRYNYSHRVSRPRIDDLNPAIIYSNERTARQGNPDIKPAETHGNEIRYEYNDRAKNINFTAVYYYRITENIVVDRSVYIDPNNTPNDPSDDVLLTRRENGPEGLENGLEFFYRARPNNKFNYDIQLNFRHEEQPPRSDRSTSISEQNSVSGRIRVGYNPTNLDQIQVTLSPQGRRLTGQGYVEPSFNWQASYGRKLNNKLRLTFSARGQGTQRTVTDNETVKSFRETDNGGTTFMVAFSFNPFGIGGGNREGGGMRQGGGNWGGGQGGPGGGGGNGPGGGF